MDFYPHLSMPFTAGGWSFFPEAALRDTAYTISQTPQLTGPYAVPTISHEPLNRKDVEASIDIRPPALERDFELPFRHRELRHVIEPELNYRYVGGIGAQARNVLLFDTTDIATNVNEAGFSLTQRFYLRPTGERPCATDARRTGTAVDAAAKTCPEAPREWASWQIAQEYFIDPNFGGALIPGRRNVFDSTLDLMAATFLTSPRNIAPITSRIRFDAIDNLRIQWDLDYDTIRGRIRREQSVRRLQLWPHHAGHRPRAAERRGRNRYHQQQRRHGHQEPAVAALPGDRQAERQRDSTWRSTAATTSSSTRCNTEACRWSTTGTAAGSRVGYRRFELGTIGSTSRDETQWLYSFTLANFGAVGDIRRANSVFRDPALPPAY